MEKKIFVFLIIFLMIYSLLWSAGIRFNISSSYPIGVWKITKEFTHRDKGQIVILQLPEENQIINEAKNRGYIKTNRLIKRVVATESDIVTVDESGITVNGQKINNTKPILKDLNGRRLYYGPYSEIVKSMHVWVVSEYNKNSFDSRYFRAINQHLIEGILIPVFVKNV